MYLTFYIVPNLNCDALIGIDLLNSTHAVIDFGHHYVSFFDGLIAINFECRYDLCGIALLTHAVRIPPMAEVALPVRLNAACKFRDSVLLEPLQDSMPIAVARTLLAPRGNKICMAINLSDKPVRLKANAPLAVVSNIACVVFVVDANTDTSDFQAYCDSNKNVEKK